MEQLTPLIQPILLLVLTVLAGAATAYVVKSWEVKKAQLSQEQLTLLNWIVGTAVWSVEQAYRMGVIKKDLREESAVRFVQAELEARGLKGINVQQIVDRVRAAVAQELNKAKIVAPSPAGPTDLPTGPIPAK